MANPLLEMRRLGQSPWHDNIKREQLTTGKLKRLIDAGEITGLTSNPTIFEQAISGTADYDRDLERLVRAGKNAEEIFYELAIDDIRSAADLFRGVHDQTGGKDGFVSIECAPRLAHDTRKSIEEAHRLWKRVDRPNLMVKIPGTAAGLPAIEQCISDGLNINVTLIFSRSRYDEVMDAYLRGLIRRIEAGQPIDHVNSVASFFVSRVDTLVDKLLDDEIAKASASRERLESLKGKAAIANAKLAYQDFREKFATEAYAGLRNHGANFQRPLWASTSTKNPAYADTYYVDALIGPDTVDTMPPATIDAYRDHGNPEVRLDKGLDEANRAMEELAAAGIDMAVVTKKLEDDGVAAFAKSFDSLIATVEGRRKAAAPARAAAKKGETPLERGQKSPRRRSKPTARRGKKPARKKTTRGQAARRTVSAKPRRRKTAAPKVRRAKPKTRTPRSRARRRARPHR